MQSIFDYNSLKTLLQTFSSLQYTFRIIKPAFSLPSHPSPLWNANGSFCSTLDNERVELQVSRGFALSVNKNIEREPGLSPCFLLTVSWEGYHVPINMPPRDRSRAPAQCVFRIVSNHISKEVICFPLQGLKKADCVSVWFTSSEYWNLLPKQRQCRAAV